MKSFRLVCVFVIFFLSFPCYFLGQSNFVSNNNDSGNLKKDTSLPVFIKIAANPQLKGNSIKKLLVGKNYREVWIQPVGVPILDLNTAYGGLTPQKLGGGKETRSLRVEDSTGREWVFRSVEKFPEKAIPPEFKKTIVEKIVEDGISASYPYGSLSMAPLSIAAHVPFFKDSLVYVDDDTALGKFRSEFKNILVLMEEGEPSGIEEKDDKKKEKLLGTNELIKELANDNNNKVDQLAVLRARLLDNFVMDFDRHEEQWDWLGMNSAEGKIFYPVPKDRDQVFYSGHGILSKLVSGKTALPETQGFREKAKNTKTFNRAAQNFDRFFLNELSAEDWSRQIDEFLNSMTDVVIDSALHKQPAEVQKYSMDKIITTLKLKRQYFRADMMSYYRFLSKIVSIVGSNQPEQFLVSKTADGKISIVVNKMDSTGNSSLKLYERTFDPAITKEIRIYGLEGNDKFVIQGGKSKIRIRMIGGPGNDEFISNGDGHRMWAYNVSFEQNTFTGNKSIHKKISADPQNNNYTRLGYRYDIKSPGISVEYSTDGGLYIGPKFKIVKQGFRKEPYSMSQLFAVNKALNSSSYHIKYNVDFVKLFGSTDLLLRSDAELPTSRTLFFGIGNNTVLDQTKPGGYKYYFARYDMVNISLMARNNINPWFQIKYGPVYQYFKLRAKENNNKYISTLYTTDDSSKLQHTGRSFTGAELGFEINTKNDPVIPTRGIDMNIYCRSLMGVNRYSNHVTQTGGDVSLFTDFISKKRVVIATGFGVSHIIGNYEWEQAQYLGYKQNLRGFRIDRFAGRSRVYNNSEVRLLKNDVNFYLFRGTLGILAFNDVGRVWADKEASTKWHDGYGWGILVAPLNRLVITASLMYSNEEKNLALINFGFQF